MQNQDPCKDKDPLALASSQEWSYAKFRPWTRLGYPRRVGAGGERDMQNLHPGQALVDVEKVVQ